MIRSRLFTCVILSLCLCVQVLPRTPVKRQQQTTKAAPTNEDVRTLLLQALKLDDEGRYAEAIEVYARALRLAPNDCGIYNNLGYNYIKLKLSRKPPPHWSGPSRLNLISPLPITT